MAPNGTNGIKAAAQGNFLFTVSTLDSGVRHRYARVP